MFCRIISATGLYLPTFSLNLTSKTSPTTLQLAIANLPLFVLLLMVRAKVPWYLPDRRLLLLPHVQPFVSS